MIETKLTLKELIAQKLAKSLIKTESSIIEPARSAQTATSKPIEATTSKIEAEPSATRTHLLEATTINPTSSLTEANPTPKESLKDRLARIKASTLLSTDKDSSNSKGLPELASINPESNKLASAASNTHHPLVDKASIQASHLPITLQTKKIEESKEVTKQNETFSLSIELNHEQLLAKSLAFNGKSFCLIGAAGTGKTTAQREIAAALIKQDLLSTHTFRIQGTGERVPAPSIAFVAYTRIASGNLRKAIHKDPDLEKLLTHNVTTIHNLLEYQPETYWDSVENKEKFRFIPKRNASNPLDITHLIIEEASMVGLDLWEQLFSALRPNVQIILIGDINQLPPVFGASILNYGLVQLPVVALTKVYRQAGDSLVLENAHRILSGQMVEEGTDYRIIEGGTVQHTQATLSVSLGKQFPVWMDKEIYDPEQDIVLSPWNKHELGTTNMNNWIAQELGKRRNAVVHEVITGISKLYLAVGDKIFYNKQVGFIKKISKNMSYRGRSFQKEGTDLTRFGIRVGVNQASSSNSEVEDSEEFFADYSGIDLDKILSEEITEDQVKAASHIVDIELETGEVHTLEAVGDFSPASFTLGYCLTVHKAQGCEWRRVFIIFHRAHRVSLSRELFYTASTRAREQVYLISKKSTIEQAIKTQRIKGNTIAEKIEFFNSGLLEAGKVVRIIK